MWAAYDRTAAWKKFWLIAAGVLLYYIIAEQKQRHIWKVIGRNIAGIPVFGHGPGAFPLRFAEWETRYLQLPEADSARRFAGLQDHAHNDYLEFAVDHGLPGLAAFMLFLALALRLFEKQRGGAGTRMEGIGAGIIALLSVALVDFPLHRPAELYLLCLLISLLWITDENGSAAAPAAIVE